MDQLDLPFYVPPEFVCKDILGDHIWRAWYTEDRYMVGPDFWNSEYLEVFDVS